MAATKLEILRRVSAQLARASSSAGVLAVVASATEGFGDVSAALCLLSDDGCTFEVVRAGAADDDADDAGHRFPVAAPLPAGDAVRSRQPIRLSSVAERDARYPALRGTPTTWSSFLILPLVVDDDHALGVLSLRFADEGACEGEGDDAFFTTLANLCAQALDRFRLLAAADDATDRMRFLSEASAALSADLHDAAAITQVTELAVPRLADYCMVALVDDQGTVTDAALRHVDPETEAALRALTRDIPHEASAGAGAALRTGATEWYSRIDDGVMVRAATTAPRMELLRRLGFGSGGVIPLRGRDRVFGVVAVGNREGRRFSAADKAIVEELAARAGVSVQSARLVRAAEALGIDL